MTRTSVEQSWNQTGEAGEQEQRCPACGVGNLTAFLDIGRMPTQIGVQWPTREEALSCQRGPISLAACEHCSFVCNTRYAPEEVDYSRPYDNDLGFSAVYQEYERDLVERLTATHELSGKQVVEIGCGNGKFLKRLCAVGNCRGVGFDPSLEHMPVEGDERVELHAGYYPGKNEPHPADLIVCRQVFEHVPDPLRFLSELRESMPADRGAVYFEVPNFEYVLDKLALWTIIYEHCSYFTRASLSAVFARAGFEVQRVYACFDDQFLGIEAVPASRADLPQEPPVEADGELQRIRDFADQLERKLSAWRATLGEIDAAGQRAVIWGAGARAVCFCSLLEGCDHIRHVVDINPQKANHYVPGTGQEIVGPDSLTRHRPDVIIVMNDIYRDEIRRTVEDMGLSVQFLYA